MPIAMRKMRTVPSMVGASLGLATAGLLAAELDADGVGDAAWCARSGEARLPWLGRTVGVGHGAGASFDGVIGCLDAELAFVADIGGAAAGRLFAVGALHEWLPSSRLRLACPSISRTVAWPRMTRTTSSMVMAWCSIWVVDSTDSASVAMR